MPRRSLVIGCGAPKTSLYQRNQHAVMGGGERENDDPGCRFRDPRSSHQGRLRPMLRPRPPQRANEFGGGRSMRTRSCYCGTAYTPAPRGSTGRGSLARRSCGRRALAAQTSIPTIASEPASWSTKSLGFGRRLRALLRLRRPGRPARGRDSVERRSPRAPGNHKCNKDRLEPNRNTISVVGRITRRRPDRRLVPKCGTHGLPVSSDAARNDGRIRRYDALARVTGATGLEPATSGVTAGAHLADPITRPRGGIAVSGCKVLAVSGPGSFGSRSRRGRWFETGRAHSPPLVRGRIRVLVLNQSQISQGGPLRRSTSHPSVSWRISALTRRGPITFWPELSREVDRRVLPQHKPDNRGGPVERRRHRIGRFGRRTASTSRRAARRYSR
jgi:hypothetical protein